MELSSIETFPHYLSILVITVNLIFSENGINFNDR